MAREEPSTETESPADEQRRNFLKGAAATGVAAIGLGAFSGGAAAQSVRNLELGDVQLSGGVLTVEIQNVNVLRNIRDNIDDVVVTVIGGSVFDVVDATLIFEEEVVEVDVSNVSIDITALNNALDNNDILVGVTVLGGGNVLATGDTIA